MNSLFESVQLGTQEFQEFRDFLQQTAGIDLGQNKQYLVATRIRRILLDYGFGNLSALTQAVQSGANLELRQRVIDAMTTNETFWFRDQHPFDYLRQTLLPELVARNTSGRIRFWSAACSSGQEPYSISMIIEEYLRANSSISPPSMEIVATDLSSSMLEKAKNGCYDQLSLGRGLSGQRLRDHFDRLGDEVWQVKAQISQRVAFRPLNLLDSFLLLGRFDVVFCRNVLIYFSLEHKLDILQRIHGIVKPGAVLLLGSSESIAGASHLFDMVHTSSGVVYRAK